MVARPHVQYKVTPQHFQHSPDTVRSHDNSNIIDYIFFFKYFWFLLFKSSFLPFLPPLPTTPAFPTSLPFPPHLGFVHVSFIVVPYWLYFLCCKDLYFYFLNFLKKDCVYLFLERGEGREKGRERAMCDCLSRVSVSLFQFCLFLLFFTFHMLYTWN